MDSAYQKRTGKVEQVLAESQSAGEASDMDLVALEEIRRVKYRYLRCVDLKLWQEMAEVFTPDATADYGSPATGQPLRFGSRHEIIAFLRDKLGPGTITPDAAGPHTRKAAG